MISILKLFGDLNFPMHMNGCLEMKLEEIIVVMWNNNFHLLSKCFNNSYNELRINNFSIDSD